MNVLPTGRHVRRDDEDVVAFTRTFRAPVEDVWAAVTESERLARWIGTWTGDPRDGHVMFEMNAEEEPMPPARFDIRACEPPHRLTVHSEDEFGAWTLTLRLSESDGQTTLVLEQLVDDVDAIENTGPGWEYYLDRLVAAQSGAEPAEVDWNHYYPAQREYYLGVAEAVRGSAAS